MKPVNAKLLAAIQRAQKGGNNATGSNNTINKQSTSQQSAMSSQAAENASNSGGTVHKITSTPGSTS